MNKVKFEKPVVEFIAVADDNVIVTSCAYNCPSAYGSYCEAGHDYCDYNCTAFH